MRVVFGADHAGFDMKQNVLAFVRGLGHEVLDVGAFTDTEPDDYPDFAEAVGKTLNDDKADRGILICGSGVGASIAVNKIPGIRAGICHDSYSAHQGVEHDNMNVLVMGSRVIGAALARELIKSYLAAQFSGEERHVRRLEKMKNIESKFMLGPHKP